MSDELLPYYNRELLHIRRAAAEFAERHPKIAGRLRMAADAIEDPHVARLIESFAFLTARVRKKLDDEFPELTDALLGVLYPHYLAPIPSMAMVQFAPAPDLASGYRIAAGTILETEPVSGERCHFRTAYDTMLWPVEITAASLAPRPLPAPPNEAAAGAASVLRISLTTLSPDAAFPTLAPPSLRFYLRGQPQQVHPLYELLCNDALSVAVAHGPTDPEPVILDASSVQPVGFARDEALLPQASRAHPAYGLLTEYFAFPEKFLLVDVALPRNLRVSGDGRRIDLFVYLRRTVPELERTLSRDNFALGVTPIVNLFKRRAEPIALDHTRTEYRVVPDVRRPLANEVYAIETVTASSADGASRSFHPFYAAGRRAGEARDAFWTATRRAGDRGDDGTELYLSLVDLAFEPSQPAGWTLSVDTICCNRDLPERLPFGGGHPRLTPIDAAPPVSAIHCLTAPTPTLRPTRGEENRWKLISHLSLNHLSLDGGEQAADALREILSLYDFSDSAETRSLIEGVLRVTSAPGVARAMGRNAGAFVRGVDVTIEFDEQRFTGSGAFLLASVLERFLGLYCSVNSFSRLTATVKGRQGILRQWPARAGERTLL
jgi:type VI secretion system protein ImpG